jgi:hypothetical protein
VPAKIHILDRWTAEVRDGVWSIMDGPEDLLTALNATMANVSGADPNADLTIAYLPHSVSGLRDLRLQLQDERHHAAASGAKRDPHRQFA